jgi:glucose/arabinose dehydrogenase
VKALHRGWLVALVVALAGCGSGGSLDPEQQSGPHPELPAARNYLLPPMQVPKGVGWQEGQAPTVAAGLRIEKIASDLLHPRQVCVLPNGDVLAVESNSPGEEPVTTPKQFIAGRVKAGSGKGDKGGNRITLLRPRAGGGPWEKHVFIDTLHSPFGVALVGDTLYVANSGALLRFPYTPGATRIDGPGVELADLPGPINHHWTKALLASPDGSRLYVGVGSNSNITENGMDREYRRAVVLEVEAATGASRIFASGLRNPTGLQWEPETGALWAIVNERDEIGPDLVPDYLTSVREGGFYGGPYSWWGQHVDERVRPQRPDLVARAIVPDYSLGSHVAALGLVFTRDNAPLPRYRGGAFVGEHGSWNRKPLSGYAVVFVRFEGGQPVGKPETVVSGFHSEDESRLFGAPVGLAIDATGALLIADDVGNAVWRVSAAADAAGQAGG